MENLDGFFTADNLTKAKLEKSEDGQQLHFTGQLSLENNGGFASFWGKIDDKLTGFDGKFFKNFFNFFFSKYLKYFSGVRSSARVSAPSREFRATVARDHQTQEWEKVIDLEKEFKSFEIPFDTFTWRFMASTSTHIPCPPGSALRRVGMLLLDGNTDPFSVDIQTIEGYNN